MNELLDKNMLVLSFFLVPNVSYQIACFFKKKNIIILTINILNIIIEINHKFQKRVIIVIISICRCGDSAGKGHRG